MASRLGCYQTFYFSGRGLLHCFCNSHVGRHVENSFEKNRYMVQGLFKFFSFGVLKRKAPIELGAMLRM
jgi:hypothetical protein